MRELDAFYYTCLFAALAALIVVLLIVVLKPRKGLSPFLPLVSISVVLWALSSGPSSGLGLAASLFLAHVSLMALRNSASPERLQNVRRKNTAFIRRLFGDKAADEFAATADRLEQREQKGE